LVQEALDLLLVLVALLQGLQVQPVQQGLLVVLAACSVP
jgi:hypothetical protein